jgi:transcriptional regulator with XRE-family HTH domain
MLTPTLARMARAALKWSLMDLQERTGISKNTLVRFETGGGIHHSTVVRIEEIYVNEGIVFTYGSATNGPSVGLMNDLATRLVRASDHKKRAQLGKRSQKTK